MESDELKLIWSSMGIAFEGCKVSTYCPELAIINTVKLLKLPEDKKILSLMLLWLQEYSEFIHIDILKNKIEELTSPQKALLGAISKKCIACSDPRWNVILKKCPPLKKKVLLGLESRIKFNGSDPEFLSMGLKISPVIASDSKKILRRKIILTKNKWLKNRLLFGTNLRADFFTAFRLKLVDNAYQAAKYFKCSLTASYKNWNHIKESSELGIFKQI